MSKASLLEELINADQEDAHMIRGLVANRNRDGLGSVLSARIACLMDPESFIQELKSGKISSVLEVCERASELKKLRLRVTQEL